MEQAQATAYSFTPFDCGVDWLTATAPVGLEGRPFLDEQNALRDEETAAGGDMKPATVRDYVGVRGEGFFIGSRRDDRIIILSGHRAATRWNSVARTARSCSRIDLQVSAWSHGDEGQYARDAYHHLKSLPPARGRPRNLTLIQSHPRGETLNVGRRISDAYGRVYDWSAAHTKTDARSVWRFEVEYKRDYARAQVAALLDTVDHRINVAHKVHSWFASRGVNMPWPDDGSRFTSGLSLKERNRDVLAWFEDSVSKTIAKEVNRVGLERVLMALGLRDKVQPIGKESIDATTIAAGSIPGQRHRRDSRPDDKHSAPLHRRSKR